ncbi:hypothetical protein ACFSJW_02045 [Flavobacterium artemisiae]
MAITFIDNSNENGAHCLQLAPFGSVVTPTGQISTFFLNDLKKLAYYM